MHVKRKCDVFRVSAVFSHRASLGPEVIFRAQFFCVADAYPRVVVEIVGAAYHLLIALSDARSVRQQSSRAAAASRKARMYS